MTMNLWERSAYYIGETYPDYYVLLGRHRDSTLLTESNFECAYAMIKEIPCSDTWDDNNGDTPEYQIVRSSHGAVGWIEFIGIHKDSIPYVEEGNRILDKLEYSLVLNDDDYSNRESEATWEGVKDSIRYAGYSVNRAEDVYQWLDANMPGELESKYDTLRYPSESAIIACAKSLGMRRVR